MSENLCVLYEDCKRERERERERELLKLLIANEMELTINDRKFD
jgi:hypothetical protein